MTSSFTAKNLRFTFTLSTNSKFSGVNNTLVISGLRATASINWAAPPSFPNANIRIYGMGEADMRALTGLNTGVLAQTPNTVLVEADSGSGFLAAFAGQIITGVPDYNSAPDVSFVIFSQLLGYELLNPGTPTSFAQPATFEQVITTIAAKMGRKVINEGVTGSFNKPVYYGNTPAEQLRTACYNAGIAYYTDTGLSNVPGASTSDNAPLGTIVIAPLGQPRDLPKFKLTPNNGLVGYPTLNSVNLIEVRSFYNPALRYGAPITIGESSQIGVNGDWTIFECTHDISSLMPDGPWFTRFTAQPLSGFIQIPG